MNEFMTAVLGEAEKNKGYAAAYIVVMVLAVFALMIYVNPYFAGAFPVFIYLFEKNRWENRGWKIHKEEDKK